MLWQLAAFVAVLVAFHTSEFALAVIYMRHQLSYKSLLISWPYTAAMAAGVTEYLLEERFIPQLKQHHAVSYMGLALVILGEGIRKMAMVTAASNFTHEIQHVRRAQHTLVTTGIYRFVRHPGYLGWFIWSVATQLLLINPVCTVVFAAVSWRFFHRRIAYEDWTLQRFFGSQHDEYVASTPSGIPFIK